VAILVHHHDVVVVIEGHHGHRTEVFDDFAVGGAAAGHVDLVDTKREDLSAIEEFG
jgi:hypothetical protein